jgi:hypothetical protein
VPLAVPVGIPPTPIPEIYVISEVPTGVVALPADELTIVNPEYDV